MVTTIFALITIALSSVSFTENLTCSKSHTKNNSIYYSSPSSGQDEGEPSTDDPIAPDEPDDPYEIYPDDESNSFSNAVSITLNTEYDMIVNNAHDTDYFAITLYAGSIITPVADVPMLFRIYRQTNSSYPQYFRRNLSAAGNIPIDKTGTYIISVQCTSYYTGFYSFSLNSVALPTQYVPYTYIKLGFTTSAWGPNLYYHDYSSAPASASKSDRPTVKNNVTYSLDVAGSTAIKTLCAPFLWLRYFTDAGSVGIYNGISQSGNVQHDDRLRSNHLGLATNDETYPANAVCMTQVKSGLTGSVFSHGSSYFVDDEYLFTAAHMMFDYSDYFTGGYTINLEQYHEENVASCPCVEAYFPYSFFADNLINQVNRKDDWAILKVDVSQIPSYYSHGFLGIKYNSNMSSFTGYGFGYPQYEIVPPGTPNDNDYYLNAFASGTVNASGQYWKTYMDLTPGQSGGPCIQVENGVAYARGSVSGSTPDLSGNTFSPINRENYSLLMSLLQ